MRIALDAMGGDFAPRSTVAGAVMALKEYPKIRKLFLYRGLVARQKQFPDFGILLQRHRRSGDGISRGIIAAHGIEGDSHGGTILRPP
jgi:hypothetical protein